MKLNKRSWFVIALFVTALLVFSIIWAVNSTKKPELSYDVLARALDKATVKSINIKRDVATVVFSDGTSDYNKDKEYTVIIRDDATFQLLLDQALITNPNMKVVYNNRYATNVWDIILSVAPTLIMVILFFMLLTRMRNPDQAGLNFSKSGANLQENGKVRFTDVAGADEEKEELVEIVDFLKNPSKYRALGARVPRGVLLVGPPGTGKTLLAKAVAGEASVPFLSISGSDFVEMYVGVGASRVRDLFETAKRNQPCIVFIDEIDAVGRQRGAGLGGGHDEREQTLNQLLVQMDGFETSESIIVMAATNRADVLDPALLRPGRFDRQIRVSLPDVRGRQAILHVHARNKPIDMNVDFATIARITYGFSGAELANVLNEAAILCARDGRKIITMIDIFEAINKVQMGSKKRSKVVSEYDKRITAYHEAGHAIVAKFMPKAMPVQEISIVPRGNGAGGYTLMRPDSDNVYESLGECLAVLAVDMGGRAAEEIVIGDFTTGASQDIRQATKLARYMVTEYGMSDIGPVYYGTSQEVFLGRDYGASHSYSEEMAGRIDAEVNKLVDEAHKKASEIINSHRTEMDKIVRLLVECETIYAEEFEMIVQGKSLEEVREAVATHSVKLAFDKQKAEREAKINDGQTSEKKSDDNAEAADNVDGDK